MHTQDLQRILTRSLDLLYSGTTNSSGLQVDCDFLLVIKTMETQLLAWHHEWLNLRQLSGMFLLPLLLPLPLSSPLPPFLPCCLVFDAGTKCI